MFVPAPMQVARERLQLQLIMAHASTLGNSVTATIVKQQLSSNTCVICYAFLTTLQLTEPRKKAKIQRANLNVPTCMAHAIAVFATNLAQTHKHCSA
eukprot:822648-Amphidinium_carterae.1